MGIIKAAISAAKGTFKDQYKEVIYCDSLGVETLLKKGQKKATDGSLNSGNDNVITDGSRISVADGQCLLIIENGNIVDFCVESGEYIYDTGTTASMLIGGFDGLKKSFDTLKGRVIAGGQVDHDQRVYFVNTKEIMGNKVGAGDIPFRDGEFNFTMKLKCFGEYSYRITDPLMFYKNVAGNVISDYTRDKIDSQFKAEIQTALQPALGRISATRIPYDQLILHTKEISKELNTELTEDWVRLRGISIVLFALASVTPDEESAKQIEKFQSNRVYTDARMMGARLGEAQANALEAAAGNENGAMNAFLGMGMAQNAGGMNASAMYQMGANEKPTEPVMSNGSWVCKCGTANSGKFCSACGEKNPESLDNSCEKCGFKGQTAFKFCPECGETNS